MNLIGVKARNALKIKIDTKIKNKVLNDYALLIDKEKKNILIQNKKDVNLAKYSWFNLGGNAEYFFKAEDKKHAIA